MRAALGRATSLGVRLNAVAPCFTPTHLTAGFGEAVAKSGLEINTTEDVAMAISSLAADESLNGVSCLVSIRPCRILRDPCLIRVNRCGESTSENWKLKGRALWVPGSAQIWRSLLQTLDACWSPSAVIRCPMPPGFSYVVLPTLQYTLSVRYIDSSRSLNEHFTVAPRYRLPRQERGLSIISTIPLDAKPKGLSGWHGRGIVPTSRSLYYSVFEF